MNGIRAPWWRGVASTWLGIVLLLCAVAAKAEEVPKASLYWRAPLEARVMRWSGSDVSAWNSSRPIDAEVPTHLEEDELLVVPARPGARLRVEGSQVEMGWGSGDGLLPDVVTWVRSGRGEFSVPAWSSARFVVFRQLKPGAVLVRVAATELDALRWHRFDGQLSEWLGGGHEQPLVAPSAEVESLVRWLSSAHSALAEASPRARHAWLMQRWLAESARQRPLVAPYFLAKPHGWSGGREVEVEGTSWRHVRAGEAIELTAMGADVVRITVQTPPGERVRLQIVEGGLVSREVLLMRRAQESGKWPRTRSMSLRAVVPGGNPRVAVKVVEGQLWAHARAYVQRTDSFDWLVQRRNRRRQLQIARNADSGEFVKALSDLDAFRTHSARERLALLAQRARGLAGALAASEVLDSAEPQGNSYELLAKLAGVDSKDGSWLPFRRRVLEQWLEAGHLRRFDDLSLSAPSRGLGWEGAHPHDQRADVALRELFWPEPSEPSEDEPPPVVSAASRRPERALEAESFAVQSGSRKALSMARRLWQEEGRWTSLEVHPETARELVWIAPEPPGVGESTCSVRSPGGSVRWRLLDGTSSILFSAPKDHYARATFRAAAPNPSGEHVVAIAGAEVTVHSLVGLSAQVAVAPGIHSVSVQGPGPVLARIPSDEHAPCGSLRQPLSWARTNPSARFTMPPGGAPTIVRVQLRPDSVPSSATEVVRVRAGEVEVSSWVRAPGTGALEAMVPRAFSELQVETRAPRYLRASARLRPEATEVRAVQRVPVAPTALGGAGGSDAVSVEQHLNEVRRATQILMTGRSELEAASWRQRRAEALRHLGFSKLAQLDEETLQESSLSADGPAERDSVIVYGTTAPVVPLGWTSRLPPLPAPEDLESLERARSVRRLGGRPEQIVDFLERARHSSGADALLLALEEERAGRLGAAAEILERLATSHGSAAAFERAATLWADEAVATKEERLSMRALIAAHRAVEGGAAAVASRARLRSAVRWVTPEPVGARGTVWVEHRNAGQEQALGERVYRAVLNAPQDAALFFRDRQLEIRLEHREPTEVFLAGSCVALGGNEETCWFEVRVDGRRRTCPALEGVRSASREEPPFTCHLGALMGAKRVEVRLVGADEAAGWIALKRKPGEDSTTRPRSISRWSLLEPEQRLRLLVAGPTVLSLKARPLGVERLLPGAEPGLRWVVRSQKEHDEQDTSSRSGRLSVSRTVDSLAWTTTAERAEGAPVGGETEGFIVVPEPGPQWVEVRALEVPTLLQIRAAVVRGLPRSRLRPEDPADNAVFPEQNAGERREAAHRAVRDQPETSWATFRAYAALYDTELTETDRDPRARFAEFGVGAQREIVADRMWLGVFGFTRIRSGQDSHGVDMNLDMSARGAAPGVFVRGHFVHQPFDDGSATGGYGSLGLLWSVPMAESLVLVPWTSATVRAVGESARLREDADPSVFTSYAENHPWTPTAGLRMDHRPFVDTILRAGASARVNPGLSDLDRVDLRGTIHWLPGQGLWPWFHLDAVLSHRPMDDHRSQAFWRMTVEPRVMFWSWLSGEHRVTLGSHAVYLRDWPTTPRSGTVSAGLVLGYDWTGHRGLSDFAPRERLFRDRLEEGSGYRRVSKGRPATTWEAAP